MLRHSESKRRNNQTETEADEEGKAPLLEHCIELRGGYSLDWIPSQVIPLSTPPDCISGESLAFLTCHPILISDRIMSTIPAHWLSVIMTADLSSGNQSMIYVFKLYYHNSKCFLFFVFLLLILTGFGSIKAFCRPNRMPRVTFPYANSWSLLQTHETEKRPCVVLFDSPVLVL